MAWYEGLSSLKGQISNFTKEIVVPNLLPDNEEVPSASDKEKYVHDLEEKCRDLQAQVEKLEKDRQRKNSDEVVDWESFKWDDSSESGGGWAEDDFQDVYLGQDGPEVEQSDVTVSRRQMAKIINEKHKLEHKCRILDQERNSFAKELEELKVSLNNTQREQDDSTNLDRNEKLSENHQLQFLIQALKDDIDRLNADKVQLRSELATMTRAVQDLESQVAVSQDENANLSSGMEELDMEHQQAIEQIMTLKNDAVRELEQLRIQHVELKSLYEAELKLKSEPQITSNSSSQTEEVQIAENVTADVHEAPVNGKLKNTGSDDQSVIPDEYFADVAPGGGTWDVKSEEIKQLQRRLQESEEEVEALEKQNEALIEKVNSLTAASEGLAPIAEGSEQVEALEQKVGALEEEVQVLREVRANLEVEMTSCKAEAQTAHAQLKALQASNKHQDNLQNEIAQLQQQHRQLTDQLVTANQEHKLQLTSITNNFDKQIEKEKLLNLELTQQITCLREEIETLRLNECDRTCQKCESKERKMCELILQKSVSDKDLEKTGKELADLEEKFSNLQDNLVSKQRQFEDVVEQKNHLEKEFSEKTQAFELLQGVHRELQAKLSDYVEGHRKNVASIDERTSEIFELQTKLKKLEDDHLQLIEKTRENDDTRSSAAVSIEVSLKELRLELDDCKKIIRELEEEKSGLHDKIDSLTNTISERDSSLLALKQQSTELIDQFEDKLKIDFQKELKQAFEEKEVEIDELKKIVEKSANAEDRVEILSKTVLDLEKLNKEFEQRCSELEFNGGEKLTQLLLERDQLIGSLQAKHTESTEYHAEIQRLNKLLSDELSKNSLLTSDVSSLMGTCTDLKQQIQGKEETLQHQHNEIMSLRVQVESLQSQLDYASQLLRVDDRQEAEGQPSSELDDTKNEYVMNLEKDQNALAGSLLQEQTRNKYLQNEVQEQHEKEASLIKEIERLREHLVNVEDNYTQEMVKAEDKVQELQQRLSQANEKVKNSSTAYTSVSIRANQQVEALQAQMKVMNEHQQQLEDQLSASEDKLQKQAAALTNLQIVLEQFQRDKEKDIALETERLKQSLNLANDNNLRVKKITESLQAQLEEAKEGLSAASRLGEQLEIKQQMIVDLNTKLQQVNEKLLKTEEKLKTTNSGVEGKVDRNLVKNLLVGFLRLEGTAQNKVQALKVLATVLDLNHEERQKIGLEADSSSDLVKQQSLSEAFVRFLENESQPQPHLKLSLGDLKSESKSRRSSSTASPSVLLSDVALSNLTQFPSGRSGTILKDVMKDDRLV